ncbi:uncharacterized protein LOC130974686 [Arachis stenosperma]|uniref:uncharacterized protein LOC130974686 n=1 Tax=Arachis stenosperma TaxID=217475 RepID=UPI0025AC918E|nr:uncharacterized protein LOC130974686 [Arachis stenosperma]
MLTVYVTDAAKEALGELRSSIENVKSLISNTLKLPFLSSSSSSPLQSLQRGNWVKLICGASFEDVVDIRNLSLVYTLSGVDCIDCAADASVVSAVNEGILAATEIVGLQKKPWVMISVNDEEETSCVNGYISNIIMHSFCRQSAQFKELWCALGDSVENLKLIVVSLPNGGDSTISSMNEMFSIMKSNLQCFNLWQLDGRPMSGDIGRGATKETIAFAIELAKAKNRPPGFLQLAGGTNAHTIDGLRKKGLFQTTSIAVDSSNLPDALIGGIAYGGYARKIVGRVLRSMQSEYGGAARIEDHPQHLLMALKEALALVGPVKCL